MSDEKPMGQVIQIDEGRIRDHLGEMVRGTVEETLNALDAEADQLCGAGRYERSQARQDTRASSYDRPASRASSRPPPSAPAWRLRRTRTCFDMPAALSWRTITRALQSYLGHKNIQHTVR